MAASPIERAVFEALTRVIDPEIRRPVTELGMIREVEVAGGVGAPRASSPPADEPAGDTATDAGSTGATARVVLALTIAGCPAAQRIEADVREAVLSVAGIDDAVIEVGVMTPAERSAMIGRVRGARRTIPFTADSLTRVICVTSGKGGVGKSAITVNLAVEAAARGLRVGLLDADVHGFSVPGLLGLHPTGANDDPDSPTQVGGLIMPPRAHGVAAISIGMFVSSGAVAWRGPMLDRTITQFLTDVHFGDLDLLFIDMPPGTGDVAISVGQKLPHADVLVVTTPQVAASEVAARSALVAAQTGQRVIGVIENMAGLVTPLGERVDLFGSGGGDAVAARLSESLGTPIPVLGRIPLTLGLREGSDAGEPVVLRDTPDPAQDALRAALDAVLAARRPLGRRALPVRVA